MMGIEDKFCKVDFKESEEIQIHMYLYTHKIYDFLETVWKDSVKSIFLSIGGTYEKAYLDITLQRQTKNQIVLIPNIWEVVLKAIIKEEMKTKTGLQFDNFSLSSLSNKLGFLGSKNFEELHLNIKIINP